MARTGEALDLTEEERRQEARVTPADFGEARSWGRRYLPAPFAGMLEAERLNNEDTFQLRRDNEQPEL